MKFQELNDEVNTGCKKGTIIYNGVQKYRQEFEGREGGGAYIYKTASGISCNIQRTLREGEQSIGLVCLLLFIDKGKGISQLPQLQLYLRSWLEIPDKILTRQPLPVAAIGKSSQASFEYRLF